MKPADGRWCVVVVADTDTATDTDIEEWVRGDQHDDEQCPVRRAPVALGAGNKQE